MAIETTRSKLRSLLREYFPAAVGAFGEAGLTSREVRAAPAPGKAARMTRRQLMAALRRSGRERDLEVWADRLRRVFRQEQMRRPPLVEDAFGEQACVLPAQLEAACSAADRLAGASGEAFRRHPDSERSYS
ncbi:hypothetical protein [Sinosporangium siamense]|uniref:Uncharacterized protein n=1 Tax=Sinosporangium siamense TaxID=1367973 RepID=A0A919RAJ1_9ACTN|nr:hypothetical protein [Sinosporangium siamense]GII90400.1 hypothetical protein Ssi02_06310 [Sinosporangium siamense]